PRVRGETAGRVAWAAAGGQAGITFLNLPARSRHLLKQWIFTQLLLRADRLAAMGSIFLPAGAQTEDELTFSAAPRPSIRLAPSRMLPSFNVEHAAPSISPRTLAHMIDAAILLTAVLLFSFLAIAMTRIIPGWPVAVPLLLAVAGLFTGAYWLLLVVWMGATPGVQLVRRRFRIEMEEERPRFR